MTIPPENIVAVHILSKGVELLREEWVPKGARDTASFAELLDIYGPECHAAAKRNAKSRLKILQLLSSDLSGFRETVSNVINDVNFKRQPYYIEWLNEFIARCEERYAKDMKKWHYQIEYIENLGRPEGEKKTSDSVTPEQIDRAKQFPITELLPFKGRTTACIWHDDRKPSLYYYPKTNLAHCFSCSAHGDSIDVMQKLSGCTFREAVRKLSV